MAAGKAVTVTSANCPNGSADPCEIWDSGTATGEIDFISIIIFNSNGNEGIQICQDNDFATSCATPSVNAALVDWIPARGVSGSGYATRYFVYRNAGSGQFSYTSYVTAPFTTHSRIYITGANGETIWWDIGYHLNSGLPWGLYQHLHAVSVVADYPAPNPTPLFSTSNGPGVIWGVDAYFQEVFGTSLETQVQWVVDGATTITSSGTEDYFGSSFDWLSGVFTTDFLGCTSILGTYTGGYLAGAYRLNVLDPIVFNSSAQLLFGNFNPVGGPAKPAPIYSLVWYYTEN